MNFIRDLAIPIILLLAIGAIIISVNSQLTNLLTLGGQTDILVVRNTNTNIDQSIIPTSAVEKLPQINIDEIVPVIFQNVSVIIKSGNFTVHSFILFECVNISSFNNIYPFQSLQSNQISNITKNSAIIGSQIVSELQLNQNDIQNYQIYIPKTNISLTIDAMVNVPDVTANNVVINFNSIHSINETYDNNYYSELLIKVSDKTKIVNVINEIQNEFSTLFPKYNCKVLQGSGTSTLLNDVITTIVKQLVIFNTILDVIIIIRILQSLFWIAQEYEYELNQLKILGASKKQIYILFMILVLIIGNLGIALGIVGSILVPTGITFLVAILTLQPVSIQPPTVFQIFENFWEVNTLIILFTFYPAFRLSSKKIIRQKERE